MSILNRRCKPHFHPPQDFARKFTPFNAINASVNDGNRDHTGAPFLLQMRM